MKKFVFKSIAIVFLSFVFWYGCASTIELLLHRKSPENALFIWGDSQTYFGLQLDKAEQLSSLKIHSAAKQGAGVYDFLVFSELVPKKSNVLIAPSIPMLIRAKNLDYNRSTLSFQSLYVLRKNGYHWTDILEIVKKNLTPHRIFSSQSSVFPNNPYVEAKDTRKRFQKAISTAERTSSKIKVFNEGLERLVNKECIISVVYFPVHLKILEDLENSVTHPYIQDFHSNLAKTLNVIYIDSLVIPCDKNYMNDWTHVNENGSNFITKQVFSNGFDSSTNNITAFYLSHCN